MKVGLIDSIGIKSIPLNPRPPFFFLPVSSPLFALSRTEGGGNREEEEGKINSPLGDRKGNPSSEKCRKKGRGRKKFPRKNCSAGENFRNQRHTPGHVNKAVNKV